MLKTTSEDHPVPPRKWVGATLTTRRGICAPLPRSRCHNSVQLGCGKFGAIGLTNGVLKRGYRTYITHDILMMIWEKHG